MMKVDGEMREVYARLIDVTLSRGRLRTARGREHYAMFNVVLVTPPHVDLVESANLKFAVAELMAYVCGWDDVSWLRRFNKRIGQFSDDGEIFSGAYGPRLAWGWETTFAKLRKDPDTRQAIIPIYHPSDVTSDSRDIPCNTLVQFQIVDGRVDMTVYQRSCDLIWGLPYDHFSFAAMLHLVAHQLELEPGQITRHIANAHVYTEKAGFYKADRIDFAREKNNVLRYVPDPPKFYNFRGAATKVRACVEKSCLIDSEGPVWTMYKLLLGIS